MEALVGFRIGLNGLWTEALSDSLALGAQIRFTNGYPKSTRPGYAQASRDVHVRKLYRGRLLRGLLRVVFRNRP